MSSEIIETRCYRLKMVEDGVVYSAVIEKADVTLDDVKENLAAVADISKGKKCMLFVNAQKIGSISFSARLFYGSEEAEIIVNKIAILVKTALSKKIYSLLFKVKKPVCPIQVFSSKEKAIAWLREGKS